MVARDRSQVQVAQRWAAGPLPVSLVISPRLDSDHIMVVRLAHILSAMRACAILEAKNQRRPIMRRAARILAKGRDHGWQPCA